MAQAKLLTAARETNCGVLSSKPSAGDFTLKRFPFTHCPFHQLEGTPECKHPEQLPSDPASGCWFILLGHLRVNWVAFDRSGSRTWMRSLANDGHRGRLSQLEKRHAVPVLHSCCWIGCHIHRDMWKMAHFGEGEEGPFLQSRIHGRGRNSTVYAAVAADRVTPTPFCPFLRSPATSFQCLWAPTRQGV